MVASLRARAGAEQEAAEVLLEVAAQTHAEQGCIRYAVHRGADDPARLVLIERWESREALDAHFTQPYVAALAQQTHLLAEPAQVWFLDPLGDEGKGRL